MAAKKKKAAKKTARKPAAKKRSALKKRKKPETLSGRSIAPGLTVSDIQRSLAWYRDVLGLVVGQKWEDGGSLMGVEMKAGTTAFWLGQDDWKKGRDRKKGEGVRLYCTTAQDLDMLATGIKQRGGVLDHDPKTQSWGTRDFGLTDPDGYKITIGT
ncbi:MAG: VOC family protein [Gemmatimonadales bacterium]|nr:VOC family protein [Gemmatimonadales bacterium]